MGMSRRIACCGRRNQFWSPAGRVAPTQRSMQAKKILDMSQCIAFLSRHKHSGHLQEVLRRPKGRCKLRRILGMSRCIACWGRRVFSKLLLFASLAFLWLLFPPNLFLLFYTLIFLIIFNMCVYCARYI